MVEVRRGGSIIYRWLITVQLCLYNDALTEVLGMWWVVYHTTILDIGGLYSEGVRGRFCNFLCFYSLLYIERL